MRFQISTIYLTAAMLVFGLGCVDSATAAIVGFPECGVSVRVPITGQPGQFKNVAIIVPVTDVLYSGVDGREGCDGEKYDYDKFTTPPSWPVTYQGTTYTEADLKRYWDWVYAGYAGGGNPDWTQNCHGYAFGVGDWPNGSSAIIKRDLTNTFCWIEDEDIADATIGTYGYGHTVKVTMEHCANSMGWIVKASSEKFKESGTYTLSGDCTTGSADLSLGNGPRANISFALYKQN